MPRAYRAPRPGTRAGSVGDNPFVAIAPEFKIGILIYFVIWRIFPELVQPFLMASGDFSSELARSLTSLAISALVLWPILANRIGDTPTGWLHPLVLPGLIGIATGFIKAPASLLDPVSVITNVQLPAHALATGAELAAARLEVQVWQLVSLIAIYIGFILFAPRIRQRAVSTRIFDSGRWKLVYAAFFGAAAVLIISSGGLEAHMAALSGGRFRALSDSGILVVPVTFMPLLSVLWFLHRPEALKSPLFILTFALSVLLQFAVTGSRSALFTAAVLMLLAWIYVYHKLPVLRLLAVGFAAVVLLGILGDLRQSGRSGQVEFDGVTDVGLSEAIAKSQQEVAQRQYESGPIGIALSVPERVDYLRGDTYVAGVFFFIPRSIWEEKPRGAGPTIAALIFGNRTSIEGYEGGGIPAGSDAEAYLNFGYFGIVLLHLLYGAFLKWISRLALVRRDGQTGTLLILVGAALSGPATGSVVPFLQKWVLLAASYRFIFRRVRQ